MKINLQVKLIIAGLFLFLLVALASAINYIGMKTLTTEIDNTFNKSIKSAIDVERLHLLLTTLESNSKRFSTMGIGENVNDINEQIDEFHKIASDLININKELNNQEIIKLLEEIDTSIETYRKNIQDIEKLYKERGFVDEGIIGQYREKAHQIEDILKSLGHKSNFDYLMVDLLEMRRIEKNYNERKDENYIQTFNNASNLFNREIRESTLNIQTKNKLISLLNEYTKLFNSVVEIDRKIKDNIAINANLMEQFHKKIHYVAEKSKKQSIKDSLSRMNKTMRITEWTVHSIVLVFGFIVIILTIVAYNHIVKPIREVLFSLNEIAQERGDLTKTLTLKTNRNDEISDLINTYNKLAGSIRSMLLLIKEATKTVLEKSEGLSASAQEMNASSEEISSTVQQMSERLQRQSNQVQQNLSNVKQMSLSMQEMYDKLKESVSASTKASRSAEEGGMSVIESMDKMKSISNLVENLRGIVNELGSKSSEIEQVIEVITSITRQTNLLALNAAIEAARAGEVGRGFAVVADEVRKLAEGSSNSAEKIRKIILEIQSETSKVVSSMEKGSKEVAESREVMNNAGVAIKEIILSIQNASESSNKMLQTIKEQEDKLKKVLSGIEGVSEMSKTTAEDIEQTAAAVEEQTASMQELSATAQELSKVADELSQLVNKFKI